jgi:uracil-DNA glycosylase family 4
MSRVNPDGNVPCDLALFGDRPGYEEAMAGKNFAGKGGRQLWADLRRQTGLTRQDFYVSNFCKVSANQNKLKAGEIAEALPEFLDELERVRPRVIVTTGSQVTKILLGSRAKLADVHGIPHEVEIAGREYTVFPVYGGLVSKGFVAAANYDLDRFSAFRKGRLRPWAAGAPVRCSWFSRDAARFCESLQPYVTGLDTEGWDEQPWGLSFSPDGTHGFVIKASDRAGLDWFRRWLKGWVPVLHNGLHDIPVLQALGVSFTEFHDTQVLAYHDIIRTGSGVLEAESQNLGTLAYRYAGQGLGELSEIAGVDFKTRTIPYTDAVMRYAAEDPAATWRLFEHYKGAGLLDYAPYQIDMGQVFLVEQMIRNGTPFDVDATTDYYADVCDKLADATTDLKSQAARYGNREFNPGSHNQVRDIITRKIGLRIRKRTRSGAASTNEKALADHKNNKFVKRLQDRRELDKLRGTYLVPLLQELVV